MKEGDFPKGRKVRKVEKKLGSDVQCSKSRARERVQMFKVQRQRPHFFPPSQAGEDQGGGTLNY